MSEFIAIGKSFFYRKIGKGALFQNLQTLNF